MSKRIFVNQMNQDLKWFFQGTKKSFQRLTFLLTLTLTPGLCLGAMEGEIKTHENKGNPGSSDKISPLFMDPDYSTQPFRVQIRNPVEVDHLSCRDEVYFLPQLLLLKGQEHKEAKVPLMLSLMKQAELLPERGIGKTILKDPASEHLLVVNLAEVERADYDSFASNLSEEEQEQFTKMMQGDRPPLEIFLTSPYNANQCFPVLLELWNPPAMAR
jgi:hypothetical protein